MPHRLLILVLAMTALAGSAPAQNLAVPSEVEVESNIVDGRYAAAEALAFARLQAIQQSAGRESVEATDATDLYVRTLIRNGYGALRSTAALAEASLTQRERLLGANAPSLAASLVNRGQILGLNARFPEAAGVLERAVTLLDAAGAAPRAVTLALDSLG